MADRKKLDLRKQPPKVVAPAAVPSQPSTTLGPGMFKPGQVIDPKYMTPFERKQLDALGWTEGTPVPGNAAELIAAIQKEANMEGVLPVPADTPPLKMPETVDISQLPAAKQRELRDALEQAGQFQEQLRAQAAATTGMAPGIAQAKQVADDVARNNPQGPGITVVDDRAVRSPQPAGSAPTVIPPGPKPAGWRQQMATEPEPVAEPVPFASTSPPIGELSSTGAVGITHCPHCSWDLKRPDPSNPTDEDKRDYLIAALGGPNNRFTHETSLLGGTIKVGYRELTGSEADAALLQIADDVRKGRVVGDGEWWQRLMDYRMTQAIDYIDINGVGRVFEGVELSDIESDDGNLTPYPALIGHLLGDVLQSESIRARSVKVSCGFSERARSSRPMRMRRLFGKGSVRCADGAGCRRRSH